MLSFFKVYRKFAIVFGIISIIIISLIYRTLNVYQPLPVYQPAMVSTDLVDSTLQYKKKYHKIADFSLANQNGDTITQEDYDGKIYVADFFFTTCQTICPIMTDHMVTIQNEIVDDDFEPDMTSDDSDLNESDANNEEHDRDWNMPVINEDLLI